MEVTLERACRAFQSTLRTIAFVGTSLAKIL